MKFYPSCISCFKIQMYILLKSDGMNKVLLWSEGYFSLTRELLQVSGKETWSNFYCNPICSIENSCDVFMGTENGGANKQKKNWCFFQQSWDYMFFAVHRSVFNQCTKIQKLICHNLSEHCTACSHFPVSAQMWFTVLFGWCWGAGPLSKKSRCNDHLLGLGRNPMYHGIQNTCHDTYFN